MLRENEENIYTNGNGEKLLGFANLNSNQMLYMPNGNFIFFKIEEDDNKESY